MKKHFIKSAHNTSAITSKGQITIPQKIREALNLKKGAKLEFVIDEGILSLIPLHNSVIALKGMLPKPQEAISLEVMNNVIQERTLNTNQ